MSQNPYLMVQSREKSKIEIGFDSFIKNVVVELETNGNCPRVKIVACGCTALAFRCPQNASKTLDFERWA